MRRIAGRTLAILPTVALLEAATLGCRESSSSTGTPFVKTAVPAGAVTNDQNQPPAMTQATKATGATAAPTRTLSRDKTTATLSEDEYKAACRQVGVSDLTKNADGRQGQLVKMTGRIVVYEEKTRGDGKATRIIISVKDDTYTLPSGILPLYVTYRGSIDSFINDNVTIYGRVYGNDDYESPQVKKKTLPRVDAQYVEKAP